MAINTTPIYKDSFPVIVNTGTTLNVPMPETVAAGDSIVIYYFARAALSAVTGFTKHGEIVAGALSGRSGFLVKPVAVGNEGGTNITLTQASSGRMAALVSIWRADGELSFSDATTVNSGTSATVTVPTITESQPFLALSVAHNEYTGSNAIAMLINTSTSDAGWDEINPTAEIGTDANRLWGAWAVYTAAATSTIRWINNASNRSGGAAMITLIEGGVTPVPVAFDGEVPTQYLTATDSGYTLDVSEYFTGNITPITYEDLNITLPAEMEIDPATGVISVVSTPVTTGTFAIVVRATDDDANEADTNSFNIVVSAAVTPPTGTTTITAVDPAITSALVTYNYDGADATGAEYRLNTNDETIASIGASPAEIEGVASGALHEIQVRHTNAGGAGPWSTPPFEFETEAAPPSVRLVLDRLLYIDEDESALVNREDVLVSVLFSATNTYQEFTVDIVNGVLQIFDEEFETPDDTFKVGVEFEGETGFYSATVMSS